MSRIASGVALSLLAAPAMAAQAVDPVQALLEQVRLWQSLGRPLEAQQALEKLYRIAPGHSAVNAEALTLQALGEIQQKQDKQALATLARLRQLYPGYAGIARVEQMRRLTGPDRGKLLTARSLFNAGRIQEAYAAFNALYQGKPPEGELALEYWQLVARLPNGGWARAKGELEKLIRHSPSNHRNRLALASIYLLHPPVPQSVLNDLKQLSQFNDSRSEALGLWRRALLQTDDAMPLASYQAYLRLAPDDETISTKMAALGQRRAKQRALLADPGYRALLAADRQLKAGDLGAAERSLQAAQPGYGGQPQYWQTLGRLRERQGRYADAVASYQRGLKQGDDAAAWRRRIVDAQLEDALAQARKAMDGKDWPAARALLDKAAALRPGAPDTLLAEADWLAGQGRLDAARDAYARALRSQPDSGPALAGIIKLYLDQGRFDEASRWLRALPAGQRRALGKAYPAALAEVERAAGDALMAEGKPEEALARLREATRLQPDNVWNRYALANALLANGQAEAGSALLRELADARAADPDALYAYALFQAKRDDSLSALAVLERVPPAARSDGLTALQRRVWLRETIRLADAELARGDGERARGRLGRAERLMRGDSPRMAELAQAWLRAGETARARGLLEKQYLEQPSADNELAYADLLLDLGEPETAAPLLDASARNREALSQAQRQTLADLQASLAVAQADAARAAGQDGQAEAILLRAQGRSPDNPRLLRNLAGYDIRAGRWEAARARLARALAAQPDDDEARLLLLDADIGSGDLVAARAGVDPLLAAKPGRGMDFRLRALDRLQQLGDEERVDAEIAALLAEANAAPGAYLRAARRAEARDQPRQAQALYRAGMASPTPAVAADKEPLHEGYAEWLDRQGVRIWQGLDLNYRGGGDGSPGTSRMSMWQAPLLVELPAPRAGRYFLRADGVRMDAGELDLSSDYALEHFGSVLACSKQTGASLQSCAAPYGRQTAQGVTLGVGYQNENWRLDIGRTPSSFPVSNAIGGIRYSDSYSLLNYKLELSRRPVTSSLLSYAGVRDPYSGQSWGGVTASGAGGSLGYDQGGRFGVWSNFSWQRLSGENVDSNRKLTAMGGVYWRLFKEPTRQLTAGVNSINFWHQKNLGDYTFGQGGYYSPKRYNSLSLPLTYAARNERWSYTLRGSVSVSSADESGAPFYPTRPDWQAQAGNPMVSEGGGPGWGASLAGAFEYQLTPRVALGGMLDLQHSQYYQPSRVLFYLRYQPGGASLTLPYPVEPLQPYSSF
ncbi:hypothetical protein CEK28_05330 [Xenophilus sp. AP218F]|nr:hypothetical protein CEK28_05330 [Xenophilus sp. AP218F]